MRNRGRLQWLACVKRSISVLPAGSDRSFGWILSGFAIRGSFSSSFSSADKPQQASRWPEEAIMVEGFAKATVFAKVPRYVLKDGSASNLSKC